MNKFLGHTFDIFKMIRVFKKRIKNYFSGASNSENSLARIAHFISEQGLISDTDAIHLIDVGARGGLQDKWSPAAKFLKTTSFDPDPKECNKLNDLSRQKKLRNEAFPYAIDAQSGKRKFYITKFPHASGFTHVNKEYSDRFYEVVSNNLEIVKEVEFETTSLDEFAERHSITDVHFIKADVEGSELSVFKGAQKIFEKQNVLGLESEVWFGPVKEHGEFSEMDEYFRENGFFLFDISVCKYPRKSLPYGYITRDRFPFFARIDTSKFGQVLTGDVVYLRDPVWELKKGKTKFLFNDSNVLKMMIIFVVYNAYDCAIELLSEYQHAFKSNLPFKELLDLLTPDVLFSKKLRYDEYNEWARKLPSVLDYFKPFWKK